MKAKIYYYYNVEEYSDDINDEQFKQYLLQKRNGIGYRSDDIGKCSIVCTQLINEIIEDFRKAMEE